MAEPQPGAQVAKALNIYLGQIYGYIKKGTVVNHKVGGYPEGKGIAVDIDEVRSAMSTSRRKGGGKGTRGPKAGSAAHAKTDAAGAAAVRSARREKMPVGQLISRHAGVTPDKDYGHRIQVVSGKYRSLTYLSATDRYTAWSTEKLRELVAKGIVQLERPENILGLIMFHWITNEQLDLATGLEAWMESVGLSVSIPDPIIVDDLSPVADEPEGEEGLASDDEED